jgi:hypothetical protein
MPHYSIVMERARGKVASQRENCRMPHYSIVIERARGQGGFSKGTNVGCHIIP